MPDMTTQQALSALDPQTQLSALEQRRRQRKDVVSAKQQERRLNMQDAQNEIQNLFHAKKLRLQEKQQEAEKEYNTLKTETQRQELNRLKIKNQVMESLNNKVVKTPSGEEMTLLEAQTLGIDMSPGEGKVEFEITDADGQRVGIFYDLENQTLKKVPIGEIAEDEETQKKFETFQGKMEEGRSALKENLGISVYQKMSADQAPKLADMTDATAGFIAKGNDPTVAANKSYQKINDYYNKTGQLTEFKGGRGKAVKATKSLIKDAANIIDTIRAAEDQGTKPGFRFTRGYIEQQLNQAGYDQAEAASIVDAALAQMRGDNANK